MTALISAPRAQEVLRLEDYNRISGPAAEPRIRGFVLAGIAMLIIFLGGSFYWAFSSELDGAVVAPASLVVEGNRKTVEHLDGGIVRSILVSDGDFVQAGQTLVELDSAELDVDLDVFGSQLGELTVRRARLMAQINGASVFSQKDVAEASRVAKEEYWHSAYLTQKQLFATEARARQTESDILDQRIESLRDQVAGIQAQRGSNARQLEITKTELGNLETLFDKGLVAATRVTARRIEIERLRGIDASLATQQAQAENQIGELKLAHLSQQKLRDEAIATELAAVDAQISVVAPRYAGATERLKRIYIAAPADGRVVNMSLFTAGGVVRPGEAILDIVPADNPLIVEARINTADIEKLKVGQSTRVRLSAFDQGDIPEATGQIFDISADSLEDARTGESYFIARVKLNADQPKAIADLELLPGMPADLFVNTGERTAISYLTQPLSDRIARTFIE
ncbi:HlyD family type I secretion periplasmic adaptor subunit [uncultured Roseobacter sp.]|uniref:HlyD family type I secretion periplasmic adaptor subunit n=1 Tax=uncultured Roseobacter sp. TaxID=114847 RepID=UPI0026204212|nr:HlyD family type I secretion periplasmic adaptor subunit [uncultured Roseobacter sp.]